MGKIAAFLLLVLTGIVLCFVIAYIIGSNLKNTSDNISKGIDEATFFETPGKSLDYNSVEIFQTLGNGIGLARAENGSPSYNGQIVLVYEEGETLYDDMIIKANKGQAFKVVGTYKYESNFGWHTVPIISKF